MAKLTDVVRRHLKDKTFWHLATVNEDGSPQVSPIWIEVDDGHVLVNTAIGRRKERNMTREPRVALSMTANDNPYERIEIRGRVVERIEGDKAERSIDALAKKYIDMDPYPYRQPGERRVLFRVEPTLVRHETG